MNEPTKSRRAKLFLNGRSQAVRLPREFRFEGTEVNIRREGSAVILEPVQKRPWPPGYWDRLEHLRSSVDLDSLAEPADDPADPLDFDVEGGPPQ